MTTQKAIEITTRSVLNKLGKSAVVFLNGKLRVKATIRYLKAGRGEIILNVGPLNYREKQFWKRSGTKPKVPWLPSKN